VWLPQSTNCGLQQECAPRRTYLNYGLDHLPNLREAQLLKLRRPLIITARHPAEGGKKVWSTRRDLLLKFLPRAKFVDVELRSLHELGAVWDEARRLRVGRICSFMISNAA